MDRFIVFIIGFVVAIVILKYRRAIKEFTGEVAFAERFLGMGGTNTLIVIIAFLVFAGSLMYAMGTLQKVLQNTIGKVFF